MAGRFPAARGEAANGQGAADGGRGAASESIPLNSGAIFILVEAIVGRAPNFTCGAINWAEGRRHESRHRLFAHAAMGPFVGPRPLWGLR